MKTEQEIRAELSKYRKVHKYRKTALIERSITILEWVLDEE